MYNLAIDYHLTKLWISSKIQDGFMTEKLRLQLYKIQKRKRDER